MRLKPGSPGAGPDQRAIIDRFAAVVPRNRARLSASVMLPPSIFARNRTVPFSASYGRSNENAKVSRAEAR